MLQIRLGDLQIDRRLTDGLIFRSDDLSRGRPRNPSEGWYVFPWESVTASSPGSEKAKGTGVTGLSRVCSRVQDQKRPVFIDLSRENSTRKSPQGFGPMRGLGLPSLKARLGNRSMVGNSFPFVVYEAQRRFEQIFVMS
jgi:hypothetical protein